MPVPSPDEIYLAKVPWNNCTDIRPVIILECLPKGRCVVVYMSASDGYEGPPQHMLLQRIDENYNDMKLSRDECYIDRTTYEIPVGWLVKRKGVLTGEMKKRFYKWFDPR